MSNIRDKICLVVQRYGENVNGGAELQCRQMAEHLKLIYDVEVLTTKAIDYMTWKDEYDKEVENINGVCVRRFSVEHPRNVDAFNQINSRFLNNQLAEKEELQWVKEQGPLVPLLIDYLDNHQDDYKAVLFFTYLYYPTVFGMKKVRGKAILIPEAHNEPFLRMKIYKDLFNEPCAFFFNTYEEERLVRKKFLNDKIPSAIGGIGIETPATVIPEDFKKKYDLTDYIIYVGRIDEGKNCHRLFQYFKEYKKRNLTSLKLVLMGKAVIDIPQSPDIVNLGFVSEEDKYNGIAGAKFLVLPSQYESLSIVVLEAMALNIPVLVNGVCEVLRGHCIKSNAGLYYYNYFEFEGAMNYLLQHEEVCQELGKNGNIYVNLNYRWNIVISKLNNLIKKIGEESGK